MKRHDTVFTIIFTILLAAYVHVSWKIEKMKDTFNKVHVNIKTEIIAPHLLNTEITFTKVDQFCPDEVITKKQILRKEIDLAVNEVKEKKLAKIAAKLKAKQEKEAKIAKAKLEKYLKRLAKIEARLKAKREREEKIALAKKLKEEARLAKIAAKLKEKQEKEEKRLAEIELKKQQVYLASLTKEEQKRYKQKIALEVENKKFKWAGTSCKSEIKSLDDWSNYFRVNYEQSSIIPSSALKHHKRIITLAVIDTGFDFGNPILREAVDAKYLKNLSQLDFSGANGKGYDDHGHGTHVAGIILGIMPQARILPLKYYNPRASGQENLDATLAALKFAIDQNVDIINYSGGGPESDVEELWFLLRQEMMA